jgi:hypothetical protein
MDLIIELKIKNPTDWDIIQPLLQRLKISFTKKEVRPIEITEPTIDAELQALQAMLADGVDASYYGDAVTYQNDIREEREQPFRD